MLCEFSKAIGRQLNITTIFPRYTQRLPEKAIVLYTISKRLFYAFRLKLKSTQKMYKYQKGQRRSGKQFILSFFLYTSKLSSGKAKLWQKPFQEVFLVVRTKFNFLCCLADGQIVNWKHWMFTLDLWETENRLETLLFARIHQKGSVQF